MSSPTVSFRSEEDTFRVLDERVADALRFMEANLHLSLSVSGVAEEAGLSPSRFAHIFRVETASSPARMLLRMRLQRAAGLLATTGLPLKQVAERVGMAHSGAFGRAFREWYGVTPSEFRRNNRRRVSVRLPGSVAGIVK